MTNSLSLSRALMCLIVSVSAAQVQENESGSGGPSSHPCPLLLHRRFDGGATCPRPRQLFHHERHLSHRASSSRKLQLKPKATTLSDMYPGRGGNELSNLSLLSAESQNPLTHSVVLVDLKIIRRGQIKGQSGHISFTHLSSYLFRRQISS